MSEERRQARGTVWQVNAGKYKVVAIQIIYMESSITINIYEIVFGGISHHNPHQFYLLRSSSPVNDNMLRNTPLKDIISNKKQRMLYH